MRFLSLILSLFALAGCQPKIAPLTSFQAANMNAMTTALVPRCVGRYLIDLPKHFVINEVARAKIEDVTWNIQPMTKAEFSTRFEARHDYLRKVLLPSTSDRRLHLRSFISLPNNASGGVFDRSSQEGSSSRTGRILELWAWKEGYLIAGKIDATDTTFPEDADDSLVKQLTTDVQEKLTHLLNLYDRTSGRADDDVPRGQGVCIRNGFIKGPSTDKEWITMNYHLSSADDVSLTVHYLSTIGPESTTLLQRGASINKGLADNNGRTLRKGERQANGLPFEEWLMEREMDPGVKDYHLTLELNSKFGNAQAPLFVMDFDSGSHRPESTPQTVEEREKQLTREPVVKATLGAAESVALWDAITSTLRIRPDAF